MYIYRIPFVVIGMRMLGVLTARKLKQSLRKMLDACMGSQYRNLVGHTRNLGAPAALGHGNERNHSQKVKCIDFMQILATFNRGI